MQPIKNWWKALDSFCKDKWAHYFLIVFLALDFGGVAIGILAMLIVPCIGTWAEMSKLVCLNSYKNEKCGNIVSKRKNFCDRCGNEVPDELKLNK